MPEPLDSADFLEDAIQIAQTQYRKGFLTQYQSRMGSTTNKLFRPMAEPVVGTGKTMQFENGPADTVRFQVDPLGNIAPAQIINPGQLTVRWNRTNLAAHDFVQASARCQFDTYTIENGSMGTVVDLAERIYNNINKDFDEKMAIMRNAGRTAQLCLVNGTPKQNDRETLTDAAATPTNTTGLRCAVDTGSISVIRTNGRYDFINPSNGAVRAGNVRCTDTPNMNDLSAGFEFVTTGPAGQFSTGNLANVADNDIVVFSGMYNAGLWSLGAYMAAPNTSAFLGGAIRTAAGSRWMIPQRILAGTSATALAKITKSHFNRLAIAMGYLGEDEQDGVVFQSGPNLQQAVRDELGEESFIQIPTSDDRSKRYANFGSVGLNYQHGTFGVVKITSDPLASDNRLLAIVNDTWFAMHYLQNGLKPIREGGSHWYRMNQSTPNTGKGLIYAADWVGNVCDFCTQPWRNGCVDFLSYN